MLHTDKQQAKRENNLNRTLLTRHFAPPVPSLTEGQGNTWLYHCCYRGDAAAAALQQPILLRISRRRRIQCVACSSSLPQHLTHMLIKHTTSAQSLPLTPSPTPLVTPGYKGNKSFAFLLSTKICRANRGLEFLYFTQQP